MLNWMDVKRNNLIFSLQSYPPMINLFFKYRRSQVRAPFLVRNMRTIFWDFEKNDVKMIDQRLLPEIFTTVAFTSFIGVAGAITDMVIRGAPAIGAAAGFGLALAARESGATNCNDLMRDLHNAGKIIKSARPTAVNLGWAVDKIIVKAAAFTGSVDDLRQFVLDLAQNLADEDVAINQRMAEYGATLISDGDTIVHHCNTGALAAVDWGTALGVIRTAWNQGKKIHVLVDETRPRLQGARLTAWELEQYGIPYEIISDNMSGYFMRTGKVQKVFFGADRVTANGDVANKIGTYMLSLAAFDNDIPAYAVVPTSTIDLSLAHGGLIPIEERSSEEVLNIQLAGVRVTPKNAKARNPAFDVTPARLIKGIVTENGIASPPYLSSLENMISLAST